MARWILEESAFFAGKFRRYRKKHPNETAAVLNNLDTYVRTLDLGVRPALIQGGFIHREPQGVVAIDQRGGAGKLRQTRLYIYAYAKETLLYLITIGDKNSQKQDLKLCRKFMNDLRRGG